MASELIARCPFCGREPRRMDRASDHTGTGWFWVISCSCGGHTAHAHIHGATEIEAIVAWNRRTPSAREQRLADTITWAFNELLGRDDIHTKFVRDRLRAALATDREGKRDSDDGPCIVQAKCTCGCIEAEVYAWDGLGMPTEAVCMKCGRGIVLA